MAFPLVALLPFAEQLIKKIWPDPAQQADAQLRLATLAQTGELAALAAETDLAKGQNTVNAIEAGSTRLFVAGWRPFVGWICGLSLGFKYIGGPLLAMAAAAAGHPVTLPDLGIGELMPLLFGMLGLGAMRTTEKIKGVA
jgi:hypothetical protein